MSTYKLDEEMESRRNRADLNMAFLLSMLVLVVLNTQSFVPHWPRLSCLP